MKALGVGEGEGKVEENVKGTMDEEDVEKAVVEPSVAPAEASVAPETSALEDEHMEVHESSQLQAESVLSAPANPNIPEPQITDRTTEPASAPDPIDTSHPVVEEPPTTDLGNEQDEGR